MGKFTFWKKGGPTLTFWPVTPSLTSGNTVPQITENAAPRRMRLLKRNAASRDRNDSIRFSLCRLGKR